MILEWTLYLEARVLNVEKFLTTSMKSWKIFLSDMMEGWRLEGQGLTVWRFGPANAVLWWQVQPDRVRQIPLWRPYWRFLWHGSGEMRLTGGFWDIVSCLWLLGPWCWKPLAVGNSWILLFPHLYLLFFSSIWLALVYATMIQNLSMQTTGTPEGVVLLYFAEGIL